jgi:hypothetical protein
MAKVLHLFGKAPEPEPEFDFDGNLCNLTGITDQIEWAETPEQVRKILNDAQEFIKDWPSG